MIDAHAHLTDERFSGEVDAVLARARAAGVDTIVTVATDAADSEATVALASVHPELYATVGVHPHAASASDGLSAIREMGTRPRVVAIGETGLDYHYDFAPRETQRRAFAGQLDLAGELGLPVVVHAREADDDLRAMLGEYGPRVAGVLHCFSSGRELLETALDLGWYISFAGLITFRRYDQAELLRSVPADRLLIETDSPYLAPVPVRGRRNEPANVPLVARKAADLRGEDPDELGTRTAANARAFYRLGAPDGEGER